MKNLTKRYVSEDAVKRALKIDSFRNLSKDKVMQFASMIPYMDKEVAIAIINQFPVYADFGKIVSREFGRGKGRTKRMEKEEISDQERQSITVDMISVADKIAEADLNNKKFLDKMSSKVLIFMGVAVAAVGAGIGINSAYRNNSSLPELQDDEDEEE